MKRTPTIAVVEDHQMLRNEISRILELLGFNVIIKAASGKDLLDFILSSDSLPDLCLLDIIMPVMNGFETAKKIKEFHPEIKILAYSLNISNKAISDILKCGADGFIFKGSDPNELKQALEKLYQS